MAIVHVMGFLFNEEKTGIVTVKRTGSDVASFARNKYNAPGRKSSDRLNEVDNKDLLSAFFRSVADVRILASSFIKFAEIKLNNDVVLFCYTKSNNSEYERVMTNNSNFRIERVSVDSITSRQGQFKCVKHFPMLVNLAQMFKIKYDEQGAPIIHQLVFRNEVVAPPAPVFEAVGVEHDHHNEDGHFEEEEDEDDDY